jgi:hypothetical protein
VTVHLLEAGVHQPRFNGTKSLFQKGPEECASTVLNRMIGAFLCTSDPGGSAPKPPSLLDWLRGRGSYKKSGFTKLGSSASAGKKLPSSFTSTYRGVAPCQNATQLLMKGLSKPVRVSKGRTKSSAEGCGLQLR